MQHQRLLASWPIRKKLLLLFSCIFLPALGIMVASGLNERQERIDKAKEQALLVAQSLAAQQDEIAAGTRQMLSTLAQLAEVQQLDAQACNELFRRLQEQNPSYIKSGPAGEDVRVVIVTAGVLEDDEQECFQAGADGFIPKPFKDHEAMAVIGRLLDVALAHCDGFSGYVNTLA